MNLFLFGFNVYLVKYAVPKFETSGVKVTILQAFKVEPFCPQKWYLNRAVRVTALINHKLLSFSAVQIYILPYINNK